MKLQGAWAEYVEYMVETEIGPAWKRLIEDVINNKTDNGKSVAQELSEHPEVKDLEDYLKKTF